MHNATDKADPLAHFNLTIPVDQDALLDPPPLLGGGLLDIELEKRRLLGAGDLEGEEL